MKQHTMVSVKHSVSDRTFQNLRLDQEAEAQLWSALRSITVDERGILCGAHQRVGLVEVISVSWVVWQSWPVILLRFFFFLLLTAGVSLGKINSNTSAMFVTLRCQINEMKEVLPLEH